MSFNYGSKNNPRTVDVFTVVGFQHCFTQASGEKVLERIEALLRSGHYVEVSFRNVETVTASFFNAAVGALYGKFDAALVENLVTCTYLSPGEASLLHRVIINAKRYFHEGVRLKACTKCGDPTAFMNNGLCKICWTYQERTEATLT